MSLSIQTQTYCMPTDVNQQKLNIYLVGPRGFCAGVDRAILMVEEALKKYGSEGLYSGKSLPFASLDKIVKKKKETE